MSQTPEIVYCASVLAKTQKDPNTFAEVHDILGSLYKEQLSEIEDLASKYSDLPEFLLDRKINWLESLGVKPLDLTAIFGNDSGGVANSKKDVEGGDSRKKKSETGKTQIKAKTENKKDTSNKTVEIPVPAMKDEEPTPKEIQSIGSKKKKNSQAAEESQEVKIEIPEEPQTKNESEEVVANSAEANPPETSTKRKKKKKKKKKSKTADKQLENEPAIVETPHQVMECKSPEEVLPLALDSGIGSCVASGGEDKSSILSGGTVESNGEANDSVAQMLNFEWDGNVINEFLQTEKIAFATIERDFISKNEDSSKRFEISFGTPFEPETADKDDNKNQSVPKKVPQKYDMKNGTKMKNQKKVPKLKLTTTSATPKLAEKMEITFGAPPDECEADFQKAKTVPRETFKSDKVDSSISTFDHASAVKFLWEEWNRTIESPLTQYI